MSSACLTLITILIGMSLGCDAPSAGGVGRVTDGSGGPQDADIGSDPDESPSDVGATELIAVLVRESICLGSELPSRETGFAAARGILDSVGSPAMSECILAADDCAGVMACRGYRLAQCDESQSLCDGAVSRACHRFFGGHTAYLERDCAALAPNGMCVTDPEAGLNAVCVTRYCNDVGRCEGDTAILCTEGYEIQVACSSWIGAGYGCVEDDQGYPECVAAGEACERSRCLGTVIEACGEGIALGRFDCAQLAPGLTCVDNGDEVGCGAPAGQLICNPESDTEGTCDGTRLDACVGGAVVALDCGTFPGGRCDDSGGRPRCFLPGWTPN